MKSCPSCHSPIVSSLMYGVTIFCCYQCYSIGFGPGGFTRLMNGDHHHDLFLESTQIKISSPPCFFCRAVTRVKPLRSKGRENLENLRVFQNWKYYYDFHRKGMLQAVHCSQCGSIWMNSRTLCHIEINWSEIEIRYAIEKQVHADIYVHLSSGHLVSSILRLLLGVPEIENTPTISELPMATYLMASLIGFFTSKGFKDPDLLLKYRLPLNFENGVNEFRLLSYAFFHENPGQFFGSILFFLVFAPMVEHELSLGQFLIFIVFTIVGVGFFQVMLVPYSLVGFNGVTSAILTFFCLRFPSSVIEFGVTRFSAPIAWSIFLFFNLQAMLSALRETGNFAQFSALSGVFFGYLFHLIFPPGPSTKAFHRLYELRLKNEKQIKNWRNLH
jgi:membrane associated rhomboid family serine protease